MKPIQMIAVTILSMQLAACGQSNTPDSTATPASSPDPSPASEYGVQMIDGVKKKTIPTRITTARW